MGKKFTSEQLIIPVYINEKIVLDMLAIVEDGFSTVSQVDYTEHQKSNSNQQANAEISTSATLLSKLLKININGAILHEGTNEASKSLKNEKIHTNVSLFSKFRSLLLKENLLNSSFDVSTMSIGDFIEAEGELQKNPLIDCMERFSGIYHFAEIFKDSPKLGEKTQAKNKKQEINNTAKQIKSFIDELTHSGTVDFILCNHSCTVVLSAQEQYLSNDNISELLGGRFKVLGKVIYICKENDKSIDLLRKSSLSTFPENILSQMFSGFENNDLKQYNLPTFRTKINGPALIVIPIAIYA